MRALSAKARARAAATLAAAALLLGARRAQAQQQSLVPDFDNINTWLSKGMAEGLGFNAGETFDPPHEVTDKRLQPDVSIGIGDLPLNRSQFPAMQQPAMQAENPAALFPNEVIFPNFTVHLRAGLPYRFDFALRWADLTTPPGYRLSSSVTGEGQSNSYGATLRRHFFGEDGQPLLSIGANYNHVRGRFSYGTTFNASESVNGTDYVVDSQVNGNLAWDVNSYGLNAVVSQAFGIWTPYAGLGYNYVTGSVTAALATTPLSFTVLPTNSAASQTPERDNGRVLLGVEREGSTFHWFTDAEVKATGVDKGQSWIIQTGVSLPFHIGWGRGAGYASSLRAGSSEGSSQAAPRKAAVHETVVPADKGEPEPGLIIIQ